MRRIVVTGLGLVTPVGHTVDEAWENIVAGRSGVSAIDTFDTSGFASRIGAAVRNFDLSPYMHPKEVRKTDSFIHYGIAAAKQAISDSGIEVTDEKPRANRNCDRFRNRGPAGDRKGPRKLSERRAAQDLALLRARQHHQHDRRELVDRSRNPGSELRIVTACSTAPTTSVMLPA